MEYDHPWPEVGLRHDGHYGHYGQYGHYGHGDPGLRAEAPGAKSNTPKPLGVVALIGDGGRVLGAKGAGRRPLAVPSPYLRHRGGAEAPRVPSP